MADKPCDERLASCNKRMDSQAGAIDNIYASKASKSVLLWTLGIYFAVFFTLIIGSYGYTKTVADDVTEIVTKADMVNYQEAIIKVIKEIK